MSKRRNPVLSVGELPDDVKVLLRELSLDEGMALKAAVAVARFRKRHRHGPTFAELFEIVLPVDRSADLDWAANVRVTYAFRHHLAVHWRRQGWIQWGRAERSLATGAQFRQASRTHARRAEGGHMADPGLVAALEKVNRHPAARRPHPRLPWNGA